jgi:hypothetical protein
LPPIPKPHFVGCRFTRSMNVTVASSRARLMYPCAPKIRRQYRRYLS